MTKPPLGKSRGFVLLYVLQHVTKRECARIMISLYRLPIILGYISMAFHIFHPVYMGAGFSTVFHIFHPVHMGVRFPRFSTFSTLFTWAQGFPPFSTFSTLFTGVWGFPLWGGNFVERHVYGGKGGNGGKGEKTKTKGVNSKNMFSVACRVGKMQYLRSL